jgi:hypothetical protein
MKTYPLDDLNKSNCTTALGEKKNQQQIREY